MPEREKIRAAEMPAEMPSQNFPTAKGKKDRRQRGRRWRAKGFPAVRKSATSTRDTAGIITGWRACTKRRSSACHGICGYRPEGANERTRCDVHYAGPKASSEEVDDAAPLRSRLFLSTRPTWVLGNARLQSGLRRCLP